MMWLQDIEQFIPFLKPLFDGLRSMRDFFTSSKKKESEHSIQIPKKTLILLPDNHPLALIWSLANSGNQHGMQITGRLQATNTSEFGIRAAGIKLLEPTDVEVVTHMLTAKDQESRLHSSKHLIPSRSIGELSFLFIVVPRRGIPGKPLRVAISILDQFGNEHVVRGLECKYLGPEQPPPDRS
jgi:hypothetical protein